MMDKDKHFLLALFILLFISVAFTKLILLSISLSFFVFGYWIYNQEWTIMGVEDGRLN